MISTQTIQRDYLSQPEQSVVKNNPQNKKTSQETQENNNLKEFEEKRSVINTNSTLPTYDNIPKYSLGLILYMLIFIFIIPYIAYEHKVRDEYLFAYIANVDMIATVLGYNGGPGYNIWRYLYNPNNTTLFGFFSTSLINYAALLGATLLIALSTYQKNSWYYGWSGAFIFLILTYLLPGNFIVLFQDYVEKYLESKFNIGKEFGLIRYLIIVAAGLIFCVSIILLEALILRATRPHIITFLKHMHRIIGYH
jgi:hypothetical protein